MLIICTKYKIYCVLVAEVLQNALAQNNHLRSRIECEFRFAQKVHLARCWWLMHYQNNYKPKNRSLFYWPLPRRAERLAVLCAARRGISRAEDHTRRCCCCPCVESWLDYHSEGPALGLHRIYQSTWLRHYNQCVRTAIVQLFALPYYNPILYIVNIVFSAITFSNKQPSR